MPNKLELTDKESVLLNTLYSIMVAEANNREYAVEGQKQLLQKVISEMTSAEKLVLNGKMTGIIQSLSPELLKSLGIEGKHNVEELDQKYAQRMDDNNPLWN